MPEMDGYEATKKIREDHGLDNMPIIAMTADAMSGVREKAINSGMNDYVTKPINPKELFRTISRWIKRKPDAAPVKSLKTVKSSPDRALPSSLPGINIDAGVERVGGNAENFRKLLVKFSENHADMAVNIRKALKAGDKEKALLLVHTLKGIAGNIGAEKLQKAALELESSIKKESRKQQSEKLLKVEKALIRTLTSIKSLPSKRKKKLKKPKSGTDFDVKKAIEQAHKLKISLEGYNTASADDFEFLKEILQGSPMMNDLEKIERLIGKYDFEGALEYLKKITVALGASDADDAK
jgi:two-component system, sensor histidine kinase and response regulator